ncbi:MAG TPA: cytochrome c oxidase subunit II, partial [Isosphaeraceae bacterium]|nr:cytochrome c oxidase subunit II [Isosphaeraceae bacterium]
MRYWSLLFALAALFAIGSFVYSPFSPDWWLPNPSGEIHHVVSKFGKDIDSLFLIILWITGIVFIGTQIALVVAAWRFVDRPGRVATY